MKTIIFSLIASVVIPVAIAPAQTGLPSIPGATPAAAASLSPAATPASIVKPAASPLPVSGTALSPVPAATPLPTPLPPPPQPAKEIRLNFQNASLSDVLSYLSEAAGFIIVQEAPVSGVVSVVSKQSMSPDDAVDLLNSVLTEKGYTAIRNGRILKIVNRLDAQKRDLPVMAGSDPAQIPRKDQMVTQILPVRYLDAAKLVENLRPLLASDSSISANESSNAIVLADTQTNVHRIAEIIRALDTNVSSISTIQVFPLQYADSKSLATVLTQLFTTDSSRNQQQGGGFGRGGGFLPPWMGGRGGGGQPQNNQSQSPAQQAAQRVVAVSDDQSNSVVVSAPEEAMNSISEIVHRLDTNIADITETRIFPLEHADAMEMANILATLYADTDSTPSSSRTGASNPGMSQFGPRAQQQTASSGRSERALLQARVVAVPDPRTNSVIVSAARESMTQIALMIGRLDNGDTKRQHVYIHPLENADPDNVASILRGMFGSQAGGSSTNGSQPTSSRLNQRSANGASSDVTDTLNTSGGSSNRLR